MSNDTQIAVEKVIRDGKVAVLVSPGFGAGWSTWSHEHAEAALYAPDVVAWVEAGKPDDGSQFERYGYTGGLRDIEIAWLPEGTQFVVDEYDGSESIQLRDETQWYVA